MVSPHDHLCAGDEPAGCRAHVLGVRDLGGEPCGPHQVGLELLQGGRQIGVAPHVEDAHVVVGNGRCHRFQSEGFGAGKALEADAGLVGVGLDQQNPHGTSLLEAWTPGLRGVVQRLGYERLAERGHAGTSSVIAGSKPAHFAT